MPLHRLQNEEGFWGWPFSPAQWVQQACGGWWAGRPEVAPVLQGHIFEVEIEPHGDVGVGGLHLQVDKALDSGLHLGRIIVVDLGAHGRWLPGVNHKNGISWSLMPGPAENGPGGWTGKEVGGCSEFLGLLHPNTGEMGWEQQVLCVPTSFFVLCK